MQKLLFAHTLFVVDRTLMCWRFFFWFDFVFIAFYYTNLYLLLSSFKRTYRSVVDGGSSFLLLLFDSSRRSFARARACSFIAYMVLQSRVKSNVNLLYWSGAISVRSICRYTYIYIYILDLFVNAHEMASKVFRLRTVSPIRLVQWHRTQHVLVCVSVEKQTKKYMCDRNWRRFIYFLLFFRWPFFSLDPKKSNNFRWLFMNKFFRKLQKRKQKWIGCKFGQCGESEKRKTTGGKKRWNCDGGRCWSIWNCVHWN